MDKIKIKVLDDGSIRIETDKVSALNHTGAENFLREIAKLAGGKVDSKQKHGTQPHTHANGVTHTH